MGGSLQRALSALRREALLLAWAVQPDTWEVDRAGVDSASAGGAGLPAFGLEGAAVTRCVCVGCLLGTVGELGCWLLVSFPCGE